jgi:predicted DNA-binding protein with PD1-like motif
MKYKINDKKIVVVIKKGEKIIESIGEVCQRERIKNGWFEGIGALDWAEIAHYDVAAKKYNSFQLEEALEMISLKGNIFLGEKGELIIHAHVSVGRPDGEMRGGHLVEARIGGACEVILERLDLEIQKRYDEETGLKLLEIE